MDLTRRAMLKVAVIGAAALSATAWAAEQPSETRATDPRTQKILDAHVHLKHGNAERTEYSAQVIVQTMYAVGIGQSIVFAMSTTTQRSIEMAEAAVCQYPQRLIPYVYALPHYERPVIREIEAALKGGRFRGVKIHVRLLASLKSSHEYTFTHVVNVGILTMAQAESLGIPGEHLHQIGVASFLHDIGKLFVPEEILNKKGKLSQDERSVIETHTVKGARYLMGTEGIPKLAVIASLEHHLKFDGSGYPSIKGGWTPNIASQMIAIADVFDAMRSRRAYQEPQPLSRIEAVLKDGAGKAFNPALIDNFFRLIRK